MIPSIIAIPAIGADPNKTWCFPGEADLHWTRGRSLWSKVPNARVYLCSFDTPRPSDSIEDYAFALLEQLCALQDIGLRPLHFAAHSVGGLVLKKALLLARQSPNSVHRSVVSRCFSIAFFGVPRMFIQSHLHLDSGAK